MRKSLMKTYQRDSKTRVSSVIKTLTNFVSCCGKVFIHTSTWMAGKDSMKDHYPQRRDFRAIWQWRASQMLTTHVLKQSGKTLDYKIRPVLWYVCTKLCPVTCRSIQKFQKQVPKILWTIACSFSFSNCIGVASLRLHNSGVEITNRRWYVTNGWKRYQEWNMS